jgi:hypothetical protein
MTRRIVAFAIVAAIAAAYANVLHGPFIFDDGNAIVENEHIRSIWPLSQSMTAPPQSVLVGRPLVCLSLALNYRFGQLDPLGYHLFNILTHMACALLLFAVIRLTLLIPQRHRQWTDPAATWFAGAAALIWALHPLQTEAVSYVTQRTETMMSACLLLMLYALARTAESARNFRWKVLAVAACAAGMGCKEIMVVAPLLAILYGWVFLPRRLGKAAYGSVMATWLILPLELWNADMDSKSGYGIKYVLPMDYLKTQAGVIVHYLRLAFWPSGQTIDYFDWPLVHGIAPAILPGLFLLALLLFSAVACLHRSWLGFLGAWFFLILGPTSSFLPNFTEIAAERRMYLPLASVVLVTLAVLWRLVPAAAARAALAAALAATLGGLTIARNALYRSPVAIWSDAVAERPNNPRAHFFLARAYGDLHDWEKMRQENEIALKLSPNFQPAVELRDHPPK